MNNTLTNASAPLNPLRRSLPSNGLLWSLRVLAIVALILSGLLVFIEIGLKSAEKGATIPFCAVPGWEWLDCKTVLPGRYAFVFGVPVAVPALGVYLAMVSMLFLLPRASTLAGQRNLWNGMVICSYLILGAAAWFIYVQIFKINAFCSWCMAEHALGGAGAILTLISSRTISRSALPSHPMSAATAAAGLMILILGQILIEPNLVVSGGGKQAGTVPGTNPGTVTNNGGSTAVAPGVAQSGDAGGMLATMKPTMGRWIETHPTAKTLMVKDDFTLLVPEYHPVIMGTAQSKRFIVEAIDYTCPHCKESNDKVHKLVDKLPDTGMLLILFPYSKRCNEFAEIDPDVSRQYFRQQLACDMAAMSYAVWLTDSAKHEKFHWWLFQNQQKLTMDMKDEAPEARKLIRQQAEIIVGADALSKTLSGDTVARLIQRDTKLANFLGVTGLPGVFIGKYALNRTIFEEEGRLLERIEKAFKGEL